MSFSKPVWSKDLPASIAVFLVALPLCLGIALASGVPLISGLVAGIVGGLIVGALSGSHVSVAGPAAGLVAIVLAALADVGLEMFLTAVVLSGAMQVVLGLARAGGIAHYFPNAVIRGLLAAIGLILILKQIPHALGYDADAEGEFSFAQADGENTFTELLNAASKLEMGAIVVALACLAVMVLWQRSKRLSKLPVPAPLAVVVLAVVMNQIFAAMGWGLWLAEGHRVGLPEFSGVSGFFASLPRPDLGAFTNPQVWVVAVTLCVVASLETLLNLEAADKLDRHRRVSPPNRELLAQGVGNTVSGLLGGLPVTSVVVRSTVNVHSGAETRASAFMHGLWLSIAVILVPGILELIPLSALAAILIVTGFKLASPAVFKTMWKRGWDQFVPFVVTVTAIVFTDLLIGIIIGLAVGLAFILRRLLLTPFLVKTEENKSIGQPARLKLAQQVTFLHRAHLVKTLESIPGGAELVIDASQSEYLDSDILDLIRNFRDVQAPERRIRLSLIGFSAYDGFEEVVRYNDVFTKTKQSRLTTDSVLQLMRDGNGRFMRGELTERDLRRQIELTVDSQHPIAAVLGCIDSRAPHEMIFDRGIGDIFSVRVAGNVVNDDVIGSLEYAAEVAKVKLLLVLGHTRCGAVGAACTGVELGHVTGLISKIKPAVTAVRKSHPHLESDSAEMIAEVVRANVGHVMDQLRERSPILRRLFDAGEVELAGGIYHIEDGRVELLGDAPEAASADSKGSEEAGAGAA